MNVRGTEVDHSGNLAGDVIVDLGRIHGPRRAGRGGSEPLDGTRQTLARTVEKCTVAVVPRIVDQAH